MSRWKKMLGLFMAGTVLIIGVTLPQKNAATAAESRDYGIRNPRVENGVTSWDKTKFGSYYQDADVQPPEPIKWRVLAVDGDDAFLLADKNLDCKPYNEEYENVTWERCMLRKWLNEDFYNEAFDAGEKKATDKVYLLSISEVGNAAYGFDTTFYKFSKTREAKNTDYAKMNNAYSSTDSGRAGNGYWWLRSPGSDSGHAAYVSIGGYGYNYGYNVVNSEYAVRPALHINLSSSSWSKAGQINSDGRVSEPTASPSPTPTEKPRETATPVPSMKPDITAEPTKRPDVTQKPDTTTESTKNPDGTQNPDAAVTSSQTPSVTAQPAPSAPAESPAPSDGPVLKKIKVSGVKCAKNAKKITGKVSVKNAAVRIKVGKKSYKKAVVQGKKFTRRRILTAGRYLLFAAGRSRGVPDILPAVFMWG